MIFNLIDLILLFFMKAQKLIWMIKLMVNAITRILCRQYFSKSVRCQPFSIFHFKMIAESTKYRGLRLPEKKSLHFYSFPNIDHPCSNTHGKFVSTWVVCILVQMMKLWQDVCNWWIREWWFVCCRWKHSNLLNEFLCFEEAPKIKNLPCC